LFLFNSKQLKMPAKKRLSTVGIAAADAPTNKKKRTSLAPTEHTKSSKAGRPKSPNVFRLPPLHTPLKDREAGELLTLGKNDVGQLGLGEDVDERKKPALVPGLEDVVSVACGGMHTVCLHKSGEVSNYNFW
jgi:regulator of chromosome condensation